MFLKRGISGLFKTMTVRLTFYYVGFFTIVSLSVFTLFYFILTSKLEQGANEKLRAEANELVALYKEQGINSLKLEFKRESESEGIGHVFLALLSPRLEILLSSDLSFLREVDFRSDALKSLSENDEMLRKLSIPGKGYKAKFIAKRTHDANIIQIGYSLVNENKLVAMYLKIFGTGLLIMLICGGCIGYLLTKRVMSGVKEITQTAISIGKGDLTRRVPVQKKGEEINCLADAFNDMLARLGKLVNELKEVTNNIAHDLRSPITRIRGLAETTLTGKQNLDEYQDMAGDIIEESDRLVALINTMLEIAENDSGIANITFRPIDMKMVLNEAYELFSPAAQDKALHFKYDVLPESLMVQGDVSRIQRVIANLLDNAFKYTPEGGSICLVLKGTQSHVMFSVADSGVGISEKDLPHVFDRFYRADKSRSTQGNGLGLSLVQSIIRAHSGSIHIQSEVGIGTTIKITLPRLLQG